MIDYEDLGGVWVQQMQRQPQVLRLRDSLMRTTALRMTLLLG